MNTKNLSPEAPIPHKIGPYEVIKSLGKGGMGEVFLVYDFVCQRRIALKRILHELASHAVIRERFLREARFAAKLSHPCIIPIYSIEEENDVYYTMAYIEGETLKDIFKSTLEKEKKELSPHEIGISIPTLTRVFLSICQAIAYAYSKNLLHRDLKPENIMVGKYGEVFLLDWGIATYLDLNENEDEEDLPCKEPESHLTRPGKVLGTVNFMAPERALKQPATIQSEIYSLGIILYQILTLKLPFFRKNLEHFRKIMRFETLELPEEIAPYRDIPKQLSLIAQKCLSSDTTNRYQSIHEVIFDLENYIEGRPEWIFCSELNLMNKEDWEFQENILLSRQMAITNVIDSLEWVGLMISKQAFSGNLKLSFELSIPTDSEGIGILMCVPEPSDRKGLEDGYCLWIGGSSTPQMTLFRSNAEIISIANHGLIQNQNNNLCIEKIDNSVLVYVNGVLKLNYISHIPIVGTHIGLLYKNPDFEISSISTFTGSQAVMVNCLSVPDAFLASKNFDQAFLDYKKIAHSFHGRTEGREAQFRSGLTLIEKAKREKQKNEKESCLSKALEEFEKLKSTPAAPLEYLGKSLAYYSLEDPEEEIKCLELALRKYPKHPLLSILKEQIVFRLHEASKQDKLSAYRFTLLCLRHLNEIFSTPTHLKLLQNLIHHWTLLPFINQKIIFSDKNQEYMHYAIQIAFWLNKPLILMEIAENIRKDTPESKALLINILFCLLYLNHESLANEFFLNHEETLVKNTSPHFDHEVLLSYLNHSNIKEAITSLLKQITLPLSFHHLRLFYYLMDKASETLQPSGLLEFVYQIQNHCKTQKENDSLRIYQLKLLLLNHKFDEAKTLFTSFPKEKLYDPHSLIHFLYGCYLWKIEGENKALDHFSKYSKDLHFSHPSSCHITGYYQEKAGQKMFFWQKIEMHKKLLFFYSVIEEPLKKQECQKKLNSLLKQQILSD